MTLRADHGVHLDGTSGERRGGQAEPHRAEEAPTEGGVSVLSK